MCGQLAVQGIKYSLWLSVHVVRVPTVMVTMHSKRWFKHKSGLTSQLHTTHLLSHLY